MLSFILQRRREVAQQVLDQAEKLWKYSSSMARRDLVRAHLATLLLLLVGLGADQQTPVPMDEEPHHHVLLKNEFVEVIRATSTGREHTLPHSFPRYCRV